MPSKKPTRSARQSKPAGGAAVASKSQPRKKVTRKARAEQVSSAPTADRLRFSPEVRREMILETAKVVLLPNPEASLDDVAEAAGVTRQLVSLYFPGGGTGPLYGAMFDEYIAALPTILGEDLLKVGTDPKRFRAATAEVVARVLDWAESVGEPWVFGDGGDHPGALIAERWKALNKVTVEMLLGVLGDVFGKPQHPARVSNAILAELNATAAVARTLLEGEIQRGDAEAVINERFVALYTVVIPALES